jgi:hypothetical protein
MSDCGKGAYPSVETLMQDMSCSNKSITSYAKEAADAGLIKIKRRYNKETGFRIGTIYMPCFPAWADLRRADDIADDEDERVNKDERLSEKSTSRPPNSDGLSVNFSGLDVKSTRNNIQKNIQYKASYPKISKNNELPPSGAKQPSSAITEKRGQMRMPLDSQKVPKKSDDDVNTVFAMLNEAMAGVWPRAASRTSKRKSAIRTLLTSEGMGLFEEIAQTLQTAGFARGEGKDGWFIRIDDILFNEDKRAKLLEGAYGQQQKTALAKTNELNERYRKILAIYVRQGGDMWPDMPDLGPRPGAPGCKIPKHILAEFSGLAAIIDRTQHGYTNGHA